ncbi:hypothetical protein EPUL_002737 [Erysiphe pulchra]|uniref:RING-type domain-containing protein n=1 Tax=Erysiphe pulchra TaxID=225359 RepID=A0A2S4PXR1_9PEZI|nr:hypothetical protein EPUL_002737 [Erysiphe pulchra]
MDDGRFMSGDFRYLFQDSMPAPNSSTRENQYYDPVHESREWHLNNSSPQAYLTQISSAWATSPAFITYENPSDNGFQELYNPLNQSQEEDDSITSAIPSSDVLRNNHNNYNTTRYPSEFYDFEGINEIESSSSHGRQNLGPNSLATTITGFMSPMFLSNPELASIDTQLTQMNSTAIERNTTMPSRPQLRPPLRRHIGKPQSMLDDCSLAKPSTQAPNEQISSVINPSEVEPVSLQGPTRLRRRHRSQHSHPEAPNLQIPSNENILRREYGAAFGNSSTGGNSTASAIREAVIRRAIFEKRIPSKSVIATLETVRLEELEKNDRSCMICYNEFGLANPEGIIELPLRLPKCKHIFGDKCIKKWFEDSDSCPYCRDKLSSEKSLKKIYGIDTPNQSRDRLVALRRRIVHAQNLSRYISSVELTNSRIAQSIQSSNILESPRNDMFRDSNSILTSDDLRNLSANRISAYDAERRRCLQGRGSSYRSANHLNRNQNGRSARSARSNLPASPDPGMFPQMFIPLRNNLSGLNTSVNTNTSPLRGGIDGQETNFQVSPTNLQYNGNRGLGSSFPETNPWRGVTSMREPTERMNEILNELRNETLLRIENSSTPFSVETSIYTEDRPQGYIQYLSEPQSIDIELQRPQLLSTPNWQPPDSRDVMSVNSISHIIHSDHSDEDTNSEDLMNSVSQSPPQPVA